MSQNNYIRINAINISSDETSNSISSVSIDSSGTINKKINAKKIIIL